MATILYFFPMNPLRVNAGSVQRAQTLLTYCRDKGHQVDFINSNDYWGGVIDPSDIEALKRQQLIRNHFSLSKKPKITHIFDFLRYNIPRVILRKIFKIGSTGIPDYATNYSRKLFDGILRQNCYDYVIVSYAFWGNLVKNKVLTGRAKTIIDTHDFITAQEQNRKHFRLGNAFADEIQRLNRFDEIWTVSADEHYLFSQFCTNFVRLVPISVAHYPTGIVAQKEFDLLYVGGDNPHNVRAIRWFFDEVYPKLPKSLRICIVGTINNVLSEYPNVTSIRQTDNLGSYYQRSRVAICPMLSGTGTKVKVVEALSYGLPVVCSPKGVDGLLNKRENGCLIADDAKQFVRLITQLTDNQKQYVAIHEEAQQYYRRYHSIDHVYAILDHAFGAPTSPQK